jgi:hypothetical protein
MSKGYFEPEHVDALVDVFTEAKRLLAQRGVSDPLELEAAAHRILDLAKDGMPPWLILGQIVPAIGASPDTPLRNFPSVASLPEIA